MRVWVLTNEYEGNIIGGLGIVATNLSKALAEQREMEVTVICKSDHPTVTVENNRALQIVRFPRNSKYYSLVKENFNALPIIGWFKAHGFPEPKLIHIHSLQCDELARYCKANWKVPIVYTCHSLIILEEKQQNRTKAALRQKNLVRIADAITVPSLWQKQQIKRYYPFFTGPVKIIHNGVLVKQKLGIRRANPYHLLYVGRLTSMKGIEELLHAVALLKRKKPQLRLDVAGKGSRGYTDKLKRLALRRNIHQHVRWLGKLNPKQVQQLYASYGAVVVPSHHESFGLVALEALAHGVPLVSTQNGGLRSFVSSRNTTIISNVRPDNIAAGIQRMWTYRDFTAKRVRNGRITAKRYGWMRISRQYRTFFSQCV